MPYFAGLFGIYIRNTIDEQLLASTAKCQQLLTYCDIFSWIIALFAVVDENFPNLAHRSEWVLYLPFVPGCTIIQTNTAQTKTNLLSLNPDLYAGIPLVGLNISSVAA